MVPASLTARKTDASSSKDKCVLISFVIFHVRQQYMTEADIAALPMANGSAERLIG